MAEKVQWEAIKWPDDMAQAPRDEARPMVRDHQAH
jgi:hypothetical protein